VVEYLVFERKEALKMPEFVESLNILRSNAIAQAEKDWHPYTFGGMYPGKNQFGETTLLPKFFKGFAGTTLTTFRQNITSTGWQNIFSMTVEEDIQLNILGFEFPDPSINVTELRTEIGDKKFPRINIEEIQSYEQPIIVFREGFVITQETSFLLRGFFEATGYQRIVPIGFTLFKKLADVITE